MKNTSPWIFPLVLMGVPFLLFVPSLSYPFLYDDNWTLIRNSSLEKIFPIMRFFLDGNTAALPASGIPKDVYRPLATLSFAINRAVSGLNPISFRSINIGLHIFNGFLLWFFLKRWVSPLAALGGALVFLLHPVQVESVVWITQRSNLICALGVLLALNLWATSPSPLHLGMCGLAFIIGLLGKETGAMFLFVAIIYSWLKGKPWKKESLVFSLILVFYFLLRSRALGHFQQEIIREANLKNQFYEALSALWHYGQTLVWPTTLNVSYRWPSSENFPALPFFVDGSFFVLGGIFIGKNWTQKPLACLGILTFFIFLIPHSGIVPLVTYAADRFLYLPLVGVAMVVASFIQTSRQPKHFFIFLVLLFGLSFIRVQDWRSEETLWRASLREDPQNAFAHACLAQELSRKQEYGEAKKEYLLSLGNRPSVQLARLVMTALVRLYEESGDDAAARQWREKLNQTISSS